LKAVEDIPVGMIRKPAPAFITKMIESEKKEFQVAMRIRNFDFLPLFKGLADEYKIDFDLKLANYFKGLIIRCGEVIYDLDCLDTNMPPLFPTYEDRFYVQRQM